MLGDVVLPLCSSGRAAAAEPWLDLFDDDARLEQYPVVGVLGAWVHVLRGRSAAATQWLAAAEGTSSDGALEPWIAVVRAATCTHGVEHMRADAERALRTLDATSGWRPTALLLRGVAQLLLGRTGVGDDSLAEAAETADALRAPRSAASLSPSGRFSAATCGDDARAGLLAAQARDAVDKAQLRDDASSALALAVSARHGLRGGDLVRAREELALASTLARRLSHSLPWLAVQVNLELARANVSLLDVPAAHDSLPPRTRCSAAAGVSGPSSHRSRMWWPRRRPSPITAREMRGP